ncbi:hypothetical protein CLU83_3862 [Flavobacterium sp. 1]|uniref:hypothetical protein n=1 Tax=Flavobacterium sp. 1 TaxID=2035200 RepID=UPI000C233883|nr:hypothetical protein [Flavobacterium sp. 1]PJJ10440.1 hypothetical protein CLU83_3862 [Flavobacterium sp. 1]
METITREEFYQKLNEDINLTDRTINSDINILILENNIKLESFTFENCTFDCGVLEFRHIKKPRLELIFKNCTFNCEVKFSDCIFDSLTFRNTKILKCLEIYKGSSDDSIFQLNVLDFSNDSDIKKPELDTDFSIQKTNIDSILFQKINHVNGQFKFLGNTVGKKYINISSFQDSTISNVMFGTNSFSTFSIFKRVIFNSTPEYLKPSDSAFEFPGFYKNNFVKVSFSESNFMGKFQFENCDFLNTTWFENCKNLQNSELKFVACKFEKYSLFDNSKFNKIEILHSKFLEKASFENLEVNYFKIHQVSFFEAAYFDDLNRNNNKAIENWDIKTLRAIKRELQRTENRIDFNRFRAYELAAHYEELNYKENFKDVAILWATKWSSNYGSWTWAFWFTLIIGFVFFTPFYILENIKLTLDLNNWEDFLYGYFRFFLITDFKNEYYIAGESVLKFNCFISLVPFIIGKIAVAFGIYEMIQSFRKFKA